MLVVLAGCLAVGAAAASIVTHESFPTFGLFNDEDNKPALPAPVANRDNKADRLTSAALKLRELKDDGTTPVLSEPLRQAYAADSPLADRFPNINAPVVIPPSNQPAKPKLVARPQAPVQKTYTLLSDAQIAGIKGRLKLTPSQEAYWPGVETALRAIAQKMHARRPSNAAAPPIDPESPEVEQLKSAAMPLLFQLREDQKREVRALARIIGLEAVASRI